TMRRFGDTSGLARLGADHFACIVQQAPQRDALLGLLETGYQEVFGAPFQLASTELRVAARSGVALFPADGRDAHSLLRGVEAALNRAKTSGARFHFYAPELTERGAEKLALENELRAALEKQEFVLHCQPKICAQSGALLGVEALMRWQRPGQGLVAPVQFIPVRAEHGLIL